MKNPIVEMSFAGGIDESVRPELLANGSWKNLENIRRTDSGGADKRFGFSSLALTRLDATSRSAGARMFADGERIAVIDGTYLDTYSTTLARNITHKRVPECSVSPRYSPTPSIVANDAAADYLSDVAYLSGYIVTATVAGATAYAVLEDTAGNIIRSPEVVLTGTTQVSVGLATYSTYFIALIIDSGSANIAAYYLDTTSATTINTGWVSIGNVATDNNTGSVVLSCQSLTASVAFVYVNDSGGASQLTSKLMTIAGVGTTQTINTNSTTPICVACEGSTGDTLWVAWDETTNVRQIGLNPTTLATTATVATILTLNAADPPTIGIVSSSSAGFGRIVASEVDRTHVRGFQISAGAVAGNGLQSTIPDVFCGGRPFRVGTRYYGQFAPAPGSLANSQGRAILCDWTAESEESWLRPVAILAPPGLASESDQLRVHPLSLGSSRYIVALSHKRTSVSRATALVTLDFADIDRWQPVAIGGTTVLGGGMVSTFDGNRVAELGFVIHPPTPSAVDSGGGSGPNGSYRYVLVYEQVDGRGNWCVSDVSDPSSSVTVVDNTITVTYRPLSISSRIQSAAGPEVRIAIYRTATGAVAPYYRVTTVNNDTSAVTATFSDSNADDAITSNAKLYTQPGIVGSAVGRESPPALTHVTHYNGMLVGAHGEDVWYTAGPVAGEEPWFSSEFQFPVEGGGEITAFESQDGTLFVFKRHRIYAVSGEAPSANNAVGGFGAPRRLAVDVGAAQRPTCVTSLGIFFISDRGVELLTRAQGVEYIGEKIKNTFASYPVVTSMTFDPDSSCVFVECAASSASGLVSGNGRTLVFDLRAKAWSVDRRISDTPAQDGCMLYNGTAWRYGWLRTNGTVYLEDRTTYLDPGSTWVTKLAEAGWTHVAGVVGEQNVDRALLYGAQHTAHDVRVRHYYDYDETTAQTKTINYAGTGPQFFDREIGQSTSQGLRMLINDATPSAGSVGTGRGGTWVCLTFSGEQHQGIKRTTSAQRGT